MPTGVQTRLYLDPHERLAFDVGCAFCGHNLRGLPPAGRCGECGQLVDISLCGSQLVGADPRWLKRVTMGVGLLASCLPWLWCPLVYPLVLVGGWLATATNPDNRAEAATRRALLRISLLWLLTGPPLMAFNDLLFFWSVPPAVPIFFVAGVLIAGWIAAVTCYLSRPVGNSALARGATVAALVFGASPALAIGMLLWLEYVSYAYDLVTMLLGLVSLLTGLGGVVLLGLALLGLWRELDVVTARALHYRLRSGNACGSPPMTAGAKSRAAS